MNKLRVLDLFSGIGGFSLGLERTGGFETVAFCEIEEFPRKILNKHWPHVPVYEDVRTLDPTRLGRIDLVCGGYPCQPFSHAGKRLGAQDDRHLWPEMCRLIKTLRPSWVIGENVAGHISMGLDDVLSDLGTLGYASQAFVIPACAVNAPHRRDRVWVVAHSEGLGRGEGREQRDVHQADGRQDGQRGAVAPGASEQPEDMAALRQTGMVAHASDMQRDGCNDNAGKRVGGKQVSESRDGGWPSDVAGATDTGFPQRRRSKRETRAKEAGAGLVAQFERCGEDVAYRKSIGRCEGQSDARGRKAGTCPREERGFGNGCEIVAHTIGPGRRCRDGERQNAIHADPCGETVGTASNRDWWATEPAVGRVAHGVPHRVDRLKALGNAVVPQVVTQIGNAILQSMEAA